MTDSSALSPGVSTFVGVAMLTASAGFGASSFRDLAKGLRSRTWPSTPGEVLESSLDQGSRGSVAILKYRYQVNGKDLLGKHLFFGDSVERSAAVISKRIHRYSVGSKVTVFYDPGRPHQAVLEPGVKWSDWTMGAVIPIVAAVLGVVFLA